jgi:hypothetical protein
MKIHETGFLGSKKICSGVLVVVIESYWYRKAEIALGETAVVQQSKVMQ